MYPTRVLSLNKGWDLLIKNKPEEWESIKQILSVITADVWGGPVKTDSELR
jgi:hypothetical protein